VVATIVGVGGAAAGGLLAVNLAAAAVPAVAVLAGLGAAGFLLGLAGLISSTTISRLSREGASAAGRSRALRDALLEIAKGNASPAPGDFDRWLPQAMAFGIGQRWVDRFRRAGHPLPEWLLAHDAGPFTFFDTVTVACLAASSHTAGASAGASGGGSSSAG
jgi:hypothetical protein